jgi:Sulfotransferase domain
VSTTNKIFVLGLSRTGTTSLHAAMVLLGHGSIHYPGHAAMRWLAGNFKTDVLSDFDACMDLPTPIYYPQLDERYPGSKFILLERDPDDWLDSLQRQWQGTSKPGNKTLLRDMVRIAVYGTAQFNPSRMRYVYHTHVANTKAYFRDRTADFMSMNVTAGDGWQKLCTFLGSRPPEGVTGFPKMRTPYIGALAAVKNSEVSSRRADILDLISGDSQNRFRQVQPPSE